VDIGEAGRQSDGGVFGNSNIGYCINNDKLPLPNSRPLDGSGTLFPYVFVAADAFTLRYNVVKPYAETNLDVRKLIANYWISRARRIVENAFGILAARFRVFHRSIHSRIDTTEAVTKACVSLHNFLMAGRQYDQNCYCPAGFSDYEINGRQVNGEWRNIVQGDSNFKPLKNIGSDNYSKAAKHTRNSFENYFISSNGEIPWQ
jgi:hypothetical protein